MVGQLLRARLVGTLAVSSFAVCLPMTVNTTFGSVTNVQPCIGNWLHDFQPCQKVEVVHETLIFTLILLPSTRGTTHVFLDDQSPNGVLFYVKKGYYVIRRRGSSY